VANETVALAVGAAVGAAALARLLIAFAWRRSILAMPNQRSSHILPTPTLGGVAIVVPVLALAAFRLGEDPLCWAVFGGGGMLAVLGVFDDLRDLPARVRFPIQCCAVGVALWAVPVAIPLILPPISIDVVWLIVCFDFLLLLWMVNLYNFMDGIDGIAASQCLIYCLGVLWIGQPAEFVDELVWVLLGSSVGFMWFNRAPARLFMGDVGSGLLGLLVGIVALALDQRRQMPLISSLILLAGFWFDATYTLCVRIATDPDFTSAHRSHLYQKCAQLFGHGRTTAMFTLFAVVWLMPLAWLVVAVPRGAFVWLIFAITPLLIGCVRLRAGHPHAARDNG